AIDFYLGAFAGTHDPRVSYVIMNLLALATLAALALLFDFVAYITKLEYSRAAHALFAGQSFVVYVACVAVPLFVDGNRAAYGFAISALDGAACIFVATCVALARRSRVELRERALVTRCAIFILVWLVFDVGNEISAWSAVFGLPQMAMSPFFLLILSVLTVICGSRETRVNVEQADAASARERGGLACVDALGLSSREVEVFALLVQGLENAHISERLFISHHTVKNHVTNIYRKAGVKNRLELMNLFALRATGIVSRE
ncbi:MAG TPA: helix-turn-helix transcriptional regulator, partial [Treponemataceae bacterium]|nr:helix-turn-helix transcriptional regulator [Treponemataceae bacterium]